MGHVCNIQTQDVFQLSGFTGVRFTVVVTQTEKLFVGLLLLHAAVFCFLSVV